MNETVQPTLTPPVGRGVHLISKYTHCSTEYVRRQKESRDESTSAAPGHAWRTRPPSDAPCRSRSCPARTSRTGPSARSASAFRLGGRADRRPGRQSSSTRSPSEHSCRPHVHTREDEFSIVTAGAIGFRSGADEVVLEAGGYIAKPRGELHTMWNAGDVEARMIEVITPAGFERFFEELADLVDRPARRTRRPGAARRVVRAVPRPELGAGADGEVRPRLAVRLTGGGQPRSLYSSRSRRPMIIFWMSLVPSPMSSIGASRYSRSISYSLE